MLSRLPGTVSDLARSDTHDTALPSLNPDLAALFHLVCLLPLQIFFHLDSIAGRTGLLPCHARREADKSHVVSCHIAHPDVVPLLSNAVCIQSLSSLP